MIKKEVYVMTNEEYDLLKAAAHGITCPDLICHKCKPCPMYINVNEGYPKDPEYRCLSALLDISILTQNIMNEKGEV